MTTLLTVVVPVRLVSEGNAREHPMKRFRRSKAQHEAIAWALQRADREWRLPVLAIDVPMDVTLTRVAPRKFDQGGNRTGAFKWVQDAVAKYLGVDDRYEERVRYLYQEERGRPREYAVRIEIARRGSE